MRLISGLRVGRVPFSKHSSAIRSSTSKAFAGVATHPSFDVLQVSKVEEYDLSTVMYKHKKTGGQVLSVVTSDDNKVFGITFRTPPQDSTGVAHILEHRKFLSKEPFVDLLKGSLQTFLNAFTYPDRTCYPVASMNTKDFYNLVDVYLDAVFYPRAAHDPQVMEQEGWHYELESLSAPLTYKGVVYNEMKGVYSSADSLLGRAIQQTLFPDNAYGVDSGGDPLKIPTLTYKDFRRFHSSTYNPSNARVFFYGDDDPYKRLEIVDEYFKDFDPNPDAAAATSVAVQHKKEFSKDGATRRLQLPYPASPGTSAETKHVSTVNWLLHDTPLTPTERMTLTILNHLLLGTTSSVLHKTLIESGLGDSVTGGGVGEELLQHTFSVGMKGVAASNVQAVEDLVLDTLRDLSRRGFDEDAIRASVNSMEFHMREFNTGGFPKGLSVMLGCMSEWIYDRDPLNGIRFEEPLAAVKRDIADGKPVFQEMLEKLFVNNTHRVAVEMIPDESLEEKTIAQEASLLASKKQGMSEEELRDIVKNTAALRTAQSAEDPPEAKATIPRLSLDDIDSTPKEIPEEVHHVLGSQGVLLTHELPSSGILYADIGLDFSKVPLDDLCLLPLFSRMLLESGTRSMDEVALSRKIDAETGGIMASWYSDLKTATGAVSDPTDVILYFMLRGKCTEDKIPVLFELMAEIVLTAKLNNKKRAIEMLLESKARRVESVVSSGHRFGATRLSSYFSFLGYMAEHTSGLSYLRSLDKLIAQAENDWPSVERRLENIRNIIISSSDEEARSSRGEQFVINFTGDKKVLEAGLDHMRIFVDSVRMRSRELPSVSANSEDVVDTWKRTVEVPRRQHSEEVSILADGTSSDTVALPACGGEGFTMNSQVNYVVKGGVMLEPGESVKGSFSVVSRHLSNGYLWDNVRVMGGAYGGFGRFSAQSGRFVFASYRDPNLAETLAIYDGASDALAAEEIDEEEILAGIMGTIGDLDSPLSVDQKGYAAMARYISRESPEDRQMWRNEILRTSSDDFKAFADRLKAVKDKGRVVVFGSKAALEGANSALPEGKKLTVAPAFGNDSI